MDLPKLLLVADYDIVFEFLLGAIISVNTLLDEDWLYRSISKDNARCE